MTLSADERHEHEDAAAYKAFLGALNERRRLILLFKKKTLFLPCEG